MKKQVWPRKFRHVDGFGDNTDYLAFYKSGHVRIYGRKGKYKITLAYDLKYAKKNVRCGIWEELSA